MAAGINCNGNSLCGGVGGRSTDILNYVQGINTGRTYQNGEHIACWESALGTGICAFLQGTGGITGDLIKVLVQDIVNHGCRVCGSVPVFFNSGDNNSNDHGELTINYVGSTGGCNGLC
ncbi:killer toxin [Trichoderma pleuroticola]